MDAQKFQDFFQKLAGAMTQQQAEFMESTNTRWMETMQGFMNSFQEASATNATAVANAMRQGQGTGDRHEVTINDKSAGKKVENFQGSTDGRVVQGFLNALESRFAMKNVVTDKEKVMIMGSYLDDTAQIWYASVVGDRYAEISYADLVEMFKQRFLSVNYKNIARKKLFALKQRGSVSAYIKSFTEYMTMVSYPYNIEKLLLDRFIDGLKPEVKDHLEVNRPSTLNSAFEIAQRVDNGSRKSGDNNWSAGPRIADSDAMRFLPVNYENIARQKLFALKQRGSVSAYIKIFTEYMTMVSYPYNIEKLLLDRFIDGLKPGVKIYLVMTRPSTLNSAFEKAQEADNVIWNNKASDNNWAAGPRIANPDAMDIDELNSKRRTRTLEEIKSGKCFKCNKFGHKIRECKSKPNSGSKNCRA